MVAETKDAGDRRPVQAQRRRRAFREFLVGASLVVFLVLAKGYFEEKTGLGQELKQEIYNLLQWKLATGSTGASIVTIVDITGLKGKAMNVDSETRSVTPRERILDLLKIIASCGPRAIGIDVDFSPLSGELITQDDEEFFRDCRRLRKKTSTPIFLGIKRTQEEPPVAWLYKAEFSDLAATIVVPHKELEKEKDSITKMPFWLQSEKSPRRACPSMSLALSGKSPESSSSNTLYERLCRTLYQKLCVRKVKPGLSLAEFFVDWSAIEDLKNNSIAATSIEGYKGRPVPQQIGRRLEKHIILIGDIKQQSANDVFIVREKFEPGVLLHACAAETLTSGPLVALKDAGRILLDVAIAGLILGSILGICLCYSRVDPSQEVNVDWLHRILTRSAIVVIFIVGFFFVHWTRLMWDDFLFVALALFVHRPVERCLATCSGKVPAVLAAVMRWWNKRVLRPKQNPD